MELFVMIVVNMNLRQNEKKALQRNQLGQFQL